MHYFCCRYVYGKMVNGEAFLSLGVQVDGRYELCHFRLKKMVLKNRFCFILYMGWFYKELEIQWLFLQIFFLLQLSSGVAIFNVSMTDVSQSLQPYWFPDGARLHIEAEVMDQASGYKEKAFDWSIAFALRPFRISVEGSRFYFKPGLNHELHVRYCNKTFLHTLFISSKIFLSVHG